jgi:hypothetical protein
MELNEGNWSTSKLRRSDEESPRPVDVRMTIHHHTKSSGVQQHSSENASQSSMNRLYLAPQSTIRRHESSPAGSCEHKSSDLHTSGNAARRRRPKPLRKTDRSTSASGHASAQFSPCQTRHYVDPYQSDSSNDSCAHPLDIAPIWGDDDEETGSVAPARGMRSPPMRKQHRAASRRRLRRFGDSGSVCSFDPASNMQDDESMISYYSNQSSKKVDTRDRPHGPSLIRRYPSSRLRSLCRRWLPAKGHSTVPWRRQSTFLQLALFLLLVIVVFDSKAKLYHHRTELNNMKEERAHILEQMTWIDLAAKKVHQHYGTPVYEGRDLFAETDPRSLRMREELDQMQLRIQQNSRERLAAHFGDGPAQVSLSLAQEGDDERYADSLIIALSDDAPHAVSTFVQQLMGPDKAWDRVTIQRLAQPDDCSVVSLQARTEKHRVFPMLEFVEKSRSCDRVGSVSLHQLESGDDQFELLMLKVRLTNAPENAHDSKDDICLGTVIAGLDALDNLLPSLPVVEIKGDREFAVMEE